MHMPGAASRAASRRKALSGGPAQSGPDDDFVERRAQAAALIFFEKPQSDERLHVGVHVFVVPPQRARKRPDLQPLVSGDMANQLSRFSETALNNSAMLPKASRGVVLRRARVCRHARVKAASAAWELSTSISIRFIAISIHGTGRRHALLGTEERPGSARERRAHRRAPVCDAKSKRGILERLQYGVDARLVTWALSLKPREHLRIHAKGDGLLRFNRLQTLAHDDPGDVFDIQLGMIRSDFNVTVLHGFDALPISLGGF